MAGPALRGADSCHGSDLSRQKCRAYFGNFLKQKMSPDFTGLIFCFIQSGLSAYSINKFIHAAVLELEGACADLAHLIAVIECPP